MATHTQFSTPANLAGDISIFPVGTAFLRSTPGSDLESPGLIAVGKCQSIGLKTTGEMIELEDEEGNTEAMLRVNAGEDLTIKARFTRNVPAPRPFQFVAIKRRRSTLTGEAGAFSDATRDEVFLVTEVSEDYGSKTVSEYSLTARRWDSLTDNTLVATVVTNSGAASGLAVFPHIPG